LNTRKDAAADSLSVERALEKLQELKNEHNEELVDRIAASQWSSINNLSEETKQLWRDSSDSFPTVWNAADC
jgi:hypothetical protein